MTDTQTADEAAQVAALYAAVERRVGWARERLADPEPDGDDVELLRGDLTHWLRRYEMDCAALLSVLAARRG